ncbi:hypothetical protein CC78DRAFT_436081, partial [Lojkania enalia]
ALDCLVINSLIYRDVKLDNILYIARPDNQLNNQYQFQLGDFGLYNRATSATTTISSFLYSSRDV